MRSKACQGMQHWPDITVTSVQPLRPSQYQISDNSLQRRKYMTPTSCINFLQFTKNVQNNCATWCVLRSIKTQVHIDYKRTMYNCHTIAWLTYFIMICWVIFLSMSWKLNMEGHSLPASENCVWSSVCFSVIFSRIISASVRRGAGLWFMNISKALSSASSTTCIKRLWNLLLLFHFTLT